MGGIALGGGGLIGVIALVISLLSGGDPSAMNLGTGAGGESSDLSQSCTTGEDANQAEDCRIVGVVNSVQEFWQSDLDSYREAKTVFYSGFTSTACGNASSAVGPFYCPLDQQVYIDLAFYDELRSRFGANGGPFAEAYVIAHEYGHHVQNLVGVLERAQSGDTGPQSSSVRVELMADCLAGVWAQHAVETGFIEDLTDVDIRDGLDAASAVGDDRIQQQAQGRVTPESFTHGSAEQRRTWFLKGYHAASSVKSCDTFGSSEV
jgi:predicted metalloprotease